MKVVLLAANISTAFRNALLERDYLLKEISTKEEILKISFAETVGIITSNKLTLDANTLQLFPLLKWIARLGSGMEIIDTDYCTQANIVCISSPQGIANSVAEHCMGMLLNVQHRITASNNEIKNKQWIREPNRGFELETLRVGIIGYGHTGMAFAKKLSVFTPNVIAFDKYKTNFSDAFVQEASLREIKQTCDVLSFHVPLTKEATHYYDATFLQQMVKPHILMNASRGAVVDTNVVLQGLASQKITGACLDVLEEESNIKSILQEEDNLIEKLMKYPVVITPHIAGYSYNAIEKMSAELLAQLMEKGY